MFNVSKRYGKIEALSNLTLEVQRNDFIFVTGPSGAGKSTMIKLLYNGEAASSGAILVDGMNMARISRKQIPMLRRKFGVIFQDFKLIPTKTVFPERCTGPGGCRLKAKRILFQSDGSP